MMTNKTSPIAFRENRAGLVLSLRSALGQTFETGKPMRRANTRKNKSAIKEIEIKIMDRNAAAGKFNDCLSDTTYMGAV